MTRNQDPHDDLSTPGDPKDNHQEAYTTVPEQDRAGTQDKGVGGLEQLQDHQSGEGAQTFKGLNSLVTRDPAAFEHAPQDAAYAGADPNPADFGDVPLSAALPGNGLGTVSVAPDSSLERDIDPNPGYTPPSEGRSSHPSEDAANLSGDMPAGAPGEGHNR